MFALIRYYLARLHRPPRAEHPHITMLVCVGALLFTVALVTAFLAMFAR